MLNDIQFRTDLDNLYTLLLHLQEIIADRLTTENDMRIVQPLHDAITEAVIDMMLEVQAQESQSAEMN
jgi:hypothetical protein